MDWPLGLGFDEAWIGEHQSGGYEIIASPEVFIAAAAGRTVDRRNWRMMGPMHLADTEAQARKNVEHGFLPIFAYLSHVIPMAPPEATTLDEAVTELNRNGSGVVGTADMAIELIEGLQKQSGGLGCFLFFGGDLADREATLRSYEIVARDVIPHFEGRLAAPQASYDRVASAPGATGEGSGRWVDATAAAIARATEDYEAERQGLRRPGRD